MKRSRHGWLLRVAQFAVVAVVLFFIVRTVVSLWPEMADIEWQVSPPFLAAAFALGVACQALLVVGWRLSLSLVGAEITWEGAAISQVWGQLAKYVPGKILTLVGKAYLASQAGASESRAALAIFVEAGAQVATALGVGSVYIIVLLPSQWELLPAAGIVVLACIGLLHPALLPRATNAAFGLLGREPVALDYQLTHVVPLACCYLAYWCVVGLGLWLLALGLGLQVPLLALTAGYAASWAIGFLSFIFPGGLGVREYALSRLLGPAAEAGTAMSIALASRAWTMAAEFPCACLIWVYRMRPAQRRSE